MPARARSSGLAVVALALGASLPAAAATTAGRVVTRGGLQTYSRGQLTLESRAFPSDANPLTEDYGAGLLARLEFGARRGRGTGRLRMLGRMDQVDPSRGRVIVEEAWGGLRFGRLDLKAGAQLLNWSVMEAFHPADIVNSRNFDGNIENLDKIGEPMFLYSFRPPGLNIQAMIMPAYMNPLFPRSSSRLSFAPPGINLGDPLWLERNGVVTDRFLGLQWGARLGINIPGGDAAVHIVYHQDRTQPLAVFDVANLEFRPLFLPVTQLGGTLQEAVGPVVLKLEAVYRIFDLPPGVTSVGAIARSDHAIVAPGAEYSLFHDSGPTSTFFLEGQAILGGASAAERDSLSPFQRDLMLGYRIAFNDVFSRQIIASLIWDTERTQEFLASASYSQRINDTWGLKGGLRAIHAPPTAVIPVGLQAFDGGNHMFLEITRSF